jgi:HAD superfamily hydrolase (TIGR01509 family)
MKGIIFDLCGTLARRRRGSLTAFLGALRARGYDVYPPQFRAAHSFVLYVDFPRLRLASSEAFLGQILERLGFEPKAADLTSLADRYTNLINHELYEDAARTVPQMHVSRRLAVVSRMPPFLIQDVLHPIESQIDAVVTPLEAGVPKPHPGIFRTALEALGVDPKDAVFVGDDPETEIEAAHEVGLPVIFVDRKGGRRCDKALATIRTLDHLQKGLDVVQVRLEGAPT